MDRMIGSRVLAATVVLALAATPFVVPAGADPADEAVDDVLSAENRGGGSLSEGETVGEEPIELLGEEPLDEEILAAGDVVKDSEWNITIDDRVDGAISADDAGAVVSGSVTGEENRNDNTNEEPSENAEMRDEAAISDTVAAAEEPMGQVAEQVDAVDGETIDEEAPDLNSGMSVSTKRATAGDTLTFSLGVSDNGSGAVSATAQLRNLDTGAGMYVPVIKNYHPERVDGEIVYVVDGPEAVGTVEVTDATDPGRWVVTALRLGDMSDNWVTYYAPGYEPTGATGYDWRTADLSALSFEVYGTKLDTEAPVLGAASVSVKRVAAGGNVTMTLKTEGHDVAEASIVYRAPQSGTSVEVPLSTKSDGVMAGTMEITDQTELGTWEARSIEWTNSEGEERSVANTALSSPENSGIMMLAESDSQDVLAGDEADLSGLTFEVVRPEELNPVPEGPGTPEEPSDPSTPSEPEMPSQPGEPQNPEVQVPAKPNPAKPGQAGIVQTGDGTPSVGLFAAMGGAIVAIATAVLGMARKLVRQ